MTTIKTDFSIFLYLCTEYNMASVLDNLVALLSDELEQEVTASKSGLGHVNVSIEGKLVNVEVVTFFEAVKKDMSDVNLECYDSENNIARIRNLYNKIPPSTKLNLFCMHMWRFCNYLLSLDGAREVVFEHLHLIADPVLASLVE